MLNIKHLNYNKKKMSNRTFAQEAILIRIDEKKHAKKHFQDYNDDYSEWSEYSDYSDSYGDSNAGWL